MRILFRCKIRIFSKPANSEGCLSRGSLSFLRVFTRLTQLGEKFPETGLLGAIVQSTRSPLILCGDFNDTPVSYTYQTIRGDLLKDGFKSCGNGYGYTFHGFFDLLRIDFILYSQGIHPVSYYSLPQEWSDHNPVFMGFTLAE